MSNNDKEPNKELSDISKNETKKTKKTISAETEDIINSNIGEPEENSNSYRTKDEQKKELMMSKFLERQKERRKKQEYQKKLNKIKLIGFTVLLLGIVVFIVFIVFKSPNLDSAEEIVDTIETKLKDKDVYIDGNKAIYMNELLFEGDNAYIATNFIFTEFGKNLLYDQNDGILSLTTPTDRIKFIKDDKNYYVNGEKKISDKLPLIIKGKQCYLCSNFVEMFYNVEIEYSSKNKTLNFESTLKERVTGVISEDTTLTDENGNSLDIQLATGDYISVYETKNGISKIRTPEGYVGFIDDSKITDKTKKDPVEKVKAKQQNAIDVKGKICLLFEQLTVYNKGTGLDIPTAVDVVIPTFFSFKETKDDAGTDGTIISLATPAYTKNAHSKGLKVWGLITDNFDSKVSKSVVKSAKKRENIVNQIITLVKTNNLDGINIDFENIPANAMREFTQFLRELSVALNSEKKVLSIDVYPPEPWTSYYNRDEFGEIVDYFIVMGYDEHTKNSETTGSVATKKWSESSISLTEKAGVPKEKLILGIPFYTRIWAEKKDGTFETNAYGMKEGYDIMSKKGAIFKWDNDLGQNYAEIIQNDITYKMWLEDEKSVEERMKIANQNNIAGIAAWRKGFEKENVWNIITKYMKQ